MSELRLVKPPSESKLVGSFVAELTQQIQGGPPQGSAFGQFSNQATGPWADCPAKGGPISNSEHAALGIPWTSQAYAWEYPGFFISADAFFRVQVRDDQGEEIISSNFKHYRKLAPGGEVPEDESMDRG